jgi:catechol 2,3-dioxygenase-like lactoylglutathione lyase family enzyme
MTRTLIAGLSFLLSFSASVHAADRDGAAIAVDAVGMTVSDLDRSIDFFTTVLSFEKVSEIEIAGERYERLYGVFGLRARVARLRLGDETIELTEYLAPRGRPYPEDSRSNDAWFQHIAIVTSDMARAYRWLREHDVEHISSGPQRLPDWNPNAGGIEAFYFRDPDDHPLEIISFPPGRGAARWQTKTDRLFLGIDHTAIAVDQTKPSLEFYRDLLGLEVAGTSENYGAEQERLNQVFGARVSITGLRAPSGPGIEFLDYLVPDDGRPRPADARANDLLHWQTTLVVSDLAEARATLSRHDVTFVSSDTTSIDDGALPFRRALLVRDPDGHALQLVEKE